MTLLLILEILTGSERHRIIKMKRKFKKFWFRFLLENALEQIDFPDLIKKGKIQTDEVGESYLWRNLITVRDPIASKMFNYSIVIKFNKQETP